MDASTVYAGWATADITPPIPVRMGGYLAREAPASGVHDALSARALALGVPLSHGGPRQEGAAGGDVLVVVVCDLLSVDEDLVEAVRQRLHQTVPGAHIWLAATHTHSGPDVARAFALAAGTPPPDPAVTARVIAGATTAAEHAIAAMAPATYRWASGAIHGVATNRDHPEQGEPVRLDLLCIYPSDVPATKPRSEPDTPSTSSAPSAPAAIFGSFPSHATVLSAENISISADLPGAFRRKLSERLGGSPWIALATGAAGDISTRHTRQGQGFAELERLGGVLAEQAEELVLQAGPLALAPPEGRTITLDLAAKSSADVTTLAERVRAVEREMAQALAAGQTGHARTLETALQGLRAEQRRATTAEPLPDGKTSLRAAIATARLGALGMVAVPGELYYDLGRQIQRAAGRPVLVLGYTNGYIGYLPARAAYGTNDYEVLMSPFAPGAAERVAQAAISGLSSGGTPAAMGTTPPGAEVSAEAGAEEGTT